MIDNLRRQTILSSKVLSKFITTLTLFWGNNWKINVSQFPASKTMNWLIWNGNSKNTDNDNVNVETRKKVNLVGQKNVVIYLLIWTQYTMHICMAMMNCLLVSTASFTRTRKCFSHGHHLPLDHWSSSGSRIKIIAGMTYPSSTRTRICFNNLKLAPAVAARFGRRDDKILVMQKRPRASD